MDIITHKNSNKSVLHNYVKMFKSKNYNKIIQMSTQPIYYFSLSYIYTYSAQHK